MGQAAARAVRRNPHPQRCRRSSRISSRRASRTGARSPSPPMTARPRHAPAGRHRPQCAAAIAARPAARDRHPVRHHQPGPAHAAHPLGRLGVPGRYADLVLLDRTCQTLSIAQGLGRWASGVRGHDLPRPRFRGSMAGLGDKNGQHPARAHRADFAIPPRRAATTMNGRASPAFPLGRRFHHHANCRSRRGGAARHERNVTKFAIVDRFSGEGKVARMFWLGTGPATPDTRAGLLGGARQAQYLGRRVVRCGHGAGRQRTRATMQGGWALVERARSPRPCATRSAA